MKTIKAILLSLLFLAAACQQQSEAPEPLDYGYLSLNLSLTITSEPANGRTLAVSTDDFRVTIFAADGTEVMVFDPFSTAPAEVSLPTGEYYVEAHSNNLVDAAFENPYYFGRSDNFTIDKEELKSIDIEAELANRQSAEADIAQRLQAARDAQAQGRIEQQGDGALALYEDVLRLQPDNAIALEGRRSLLAELLRDAERALADGDLRTAGALVDRVVKADPSHLGLPSVQARLGEARAAGENAREAALKAAQAELRAGRIEAAALGFQALLAERPDDVEARQGMDDAAAMLSARASRYAADFEFDAAADAINRAREWAPDSPAVAAAERRLEQAREARDEVPGQALDPDELDALLDEAAAAMRAGDLVDPPGASAWDLLRRAQAMAPDNGAVRRAFVEYGRRARACFEDELAGNRLGAAQACLDALAVRDRGGDELAPDRRRLADRWLAFGEERLGAGEFALARRALSAAREVDPSNPRLETFAERLRRAGG